MADDDFELLYEEEEPHDDNHDNQGEQYGHHGSGTVHEATEAVDGQGHYQAHGSAQETRAEQKTEQKRPKERIVFHDPRPKQEPAKDEVPSSHPAGPSQPAPSAQQPGKRLHSPPQGRPPKRQAGLRSCFIIRSNNQENLDISVREAAWATQKHNEQILNERFHNGHEVTLLFSVNQSHHFQGYAVMRTACGKLGRKVFWSNGQVFGGAFGVDWKLQYNLPYEAVRNLKNPLNSNKPVSSARDGQEVPDYIADQVIQAMEAAAASDGVRGLPRAIMRGPPAQPPPPPRPGSKPGMQGRGAGSGPNNMPRRGDSMGRGGMNGSKPGNMFMDGPMNQMEMAMMNDPMAAAMMGMGGMAGRPGMMGGMGGLLDGMPNATPLMMQGAMYGGMNPMAAMGGPGGRPNMGMGPQGGMGGMAPGMQGSMMQGGPAMPMSGALNGDMGRGRGRSRSRSPTRRRNRSRSRSRSLDSKPDLLNLSYEEYVDYHRKLKQKVGEMGDSRKSMPDRDNGRTNGAAAMPTVSGTNSQGMMANAGGGMMGNMMGGGMPGGMMPGMGNNMAGGMGGAMGGMGGAMGGMGTMSGAMAGGMGGAMGGGMGGAMGGMPGPMGGMFGNMQGMGNMGALNPMMAAGMQGMAPNMMNTMSGGMGNMNVGMMQSKPTGQPYSETEYIQLTLSQFRAKGLPPPTTEYIRNYYRQMKQQYEVNQGGRR